MSTTTGGLPIPAAHLSTDSPERWQWLGGKSSPRLTARPCICIYIFYICIYCISLLNFIPARLCPLQGSIFPENLFYHLSLIPCLHLPTVLIFHESKFLDLYPFITSSFNVSISWYIRFSKPLSWMYPSDHPLIQIFNFYDQ
jgi:hypothetical protein